MGRSEQFGSIIASINYNDGKHRERSAIFVRPARLAEVPNALDLSDAKALRDHLSALITQVEAGIEEQRKPKQPGPAYGSVTIRFEGFVPAYRQGDKWRFLFEGSQAYTWDELLEFVNHAPFEILYPKEG